MIWKRAWTQVNWEKFGNRIAYSQCRTQRAPDYKAIRKVCHHQHYIACIPNYHGLITVF
jgi:glucose-6-phosphate 1-dehydrogenase